MRARIVIAFLLLTSCIPKSEPPQRPPAASPVETSQATQQCHADLRREGVEFRILPDRTFAGGCSAIGAVQLLDIGVPVTNLGAMTCPLARSLGRWAREAVQTAAEQWMKSRVTRIESFGTYACRPVNSQPGARLSEHGRANAVDIAAFTFANGRRVTVLAGWNGADEDERRFLRAVHQAGCRRFAVSLGPDANALHHDHFHFDMGQGPYCR
jgi:hypothetical protein